MRFKERIPQKFKNLVHVVTRRKKKKSKLSFGIDLVKHCNLNCRGCDHFSCIAKEEFAIYENVERDLLRIKELFRDRVERIKLLGGEPLLNKDINKYCDLVRSIFPEVSICIITNGTLLLNQNDTFWNNCKKNNITIMPTKYPIKYDYGKAERVASEYGLKFDYMGESDEVIKDMYCVPIDLKGSQSKCLSFSACAKGNECITLENGKLYTCTLIPNIRIFNSFFEKDLELTEDDYIDIYKYDSADEILDRLAKPVPFCRFCNNLNYRRGIPWGVTKGDINEWI